MFDSQRQKTKNEAAPEENQPEQTSSTTVSDSAQTPLWMSGAARHNKPADHSATDRRRDDKQDSDSGAHNRTGMPNRLKAGLESLSGLDLSDVRVHHNSAKPEQIAALAYTQGRDIYVGPGQEQYLAHEGWHVVQQMQGRVTPERQVQGMQISDNAGLEHEAEVMGTRALQQHPAQQRSPAVAASAPQYAGVAQPVVQRVNYVVQTTQEVALRASPGETAPQSENFVEQDAPGLLIRQNTELDLLDSRGEWIQVEGPAVTPAETMVELGYNDAGIRTGWIRRDETNLAPAADTATENLRVAQDLDDLMDAHILPAMLRWESGIRIQGQAYSLAYERFSDTLQDASQQAKARADFYAAVLTTVSVGALGWMGDMAMNAESVTRILRSEAVRGSIEDAIQTGVGEGIDLLQGGWFTQHINRETHPLRYLNGALTALADTKAELIQHIGDSKLRIGRSSTRVDRARVLIETYKWWTDARVRHDPNVTQEDKEPMAREFERGFWAQYIKEDLTRVAPLPYYEGWTLHTYHHPESAVETRLDQLDISDEAGIDEWDSWYEFTDTAGPRDIADHVRAIGSPWTQKLYRWARSYTPETFS